MMFVGAGKNYKVQIPTKIKAMAKQLTDAEIRDIKGTKEKIIKSQEVVKK